MRKLRALLLAVALSGAAGLAACGGGGDEDNLFVGTWLSATGNEIIFDKDTWVDSDGDSGTYLRTGVYPEFTVTFVMEAGPFARRATFLDEHTMVLCEVFVNGVLWQCVDLVRDRPIAPG